MSVSHCAGDHAHDACYPESFLHTLLQWHSWNKRVLSLSPSAHRKRHFWQECENRTIISSDEFKGRGGMEMCHIVDYVVLCKKSVNRNGITAMHRLSCEATWAHVYYTAWTQGKMQLPRRCSHNEMCLWVKTVTHGDLHRGFMLFLPGKVLHRKKWFVCVLSGPLKCIVG